MSSRSSSFAAVDCRWPRESRRALALDGERGVAGADHERRLYILGTVLIDADRPKEAKRVLDESIALTERDLGKRHPLLAAALMSRGGAYRLMYEWDRAREDLQRALDLQQSIWGPDSFQTGAAFANLALLDDSRKQFDQAEQNLRRAYAIYLKVYGPEHSRSMRLLYRLGLTLSSAGRLHEAEGVLNSALAGLIRVLGKNHRYVAEAERTIGKLEEKQHRPIKALEYYSAAADALRTTEGPSSKLLWRVYSSMGDSSMDLKQYAAACAHYEEAMAVAGEDASGGSHRATLETSYAEALLASGRRPEALAHVMKARRNPRRHRRAREGLPRRGRQLDQAALPRRIRAGCPLISGLLRLSV